MHSGAELRLASQRVSPGFVASRLFHQNGAHSPGIRGRIRASSGSLSDADTPEIVPTPPNLGGKSPRKSWNAASLAFLGDSVWEVGNL